jgi:hypothetical protein
MAKGCFVVRAEVPMRRTARHSITGFRASQPRLCRPIDNSQSNLC